jgi:predicted  nucleic acid-binding Zn-ribbon protein
MTVLQSDEIAIAPELIEAIRQFPNTREVTHCGTTFSVSPLAIYTDCPHCGQRLKLRSFAGVPEIEDAIDAVLKWMNDPTARAAAVARQAELANDD